MVATALLAWQRSLYLANYETAGERIAAVQLEASVTYADGTTEMRAYRIGLVDNYEQVISGRFDAFCELDDDFSDVLDLKLPWHRWSTPTNEQIAADPRLSAAIFEIEDVTEG